MRWKERAFMNAISIGNGFTITGAYFACLDRKTGDVTALYYDKSTPSQQLNLTAGATGTFNFV